MALLDTHKLSMRIMHSHAGSLIARPWLDRSVAYLLETWFFPLSRLWAAARAAAGDVDAFIRHVPLSEPSPSQRRKISRALNQFERCRLKAYSTEHLWNDYFFGDEPVEDIRLPIVEEMRLDFRTRYNLTRRAFRPLRKLVLTSVYMDPPSPDDVMARFGRNGESVEALFALPTSLPDIEVSRPLPTDDGVDRWIRFESPSKPLGDVAYARVHEPAGVKNPPTLIFGHGICVEFDHYHHLIDEVSELTRNGIRVIRPEAPWHGRRVLPGHYGGEQLLSRLPNSMFDFVAAQHQEWATIINWARDTSDGPVAIGGSSLGAQTAKAIAVRACGWPEHLRPDALLAITHSQHMYEAALHGSLSDIWNLGTVMRDRGWHRDTELQWLEKLDPLGKPCMTGERIVSVIGDRDTVTPTTLVNEQLDFWGVPAANRFHVDRGHFTVPLGLIHDNTPLMAFVDILKRA
jgi:hypothetical protein